MSTWRDVCERLCGLVEWSRVGGEAAALRRRDDFEAAALALVKRLRARKKPTLGVERAHVRRLREAATAEARAAALKAVEAYRFDSGIEGIAFCRSLPAETWQVGGTTAQFERLTKLMLDDEPRWGHWHHQTIYRLFDFVQSCWAIDECPDRFFVPALCWMRAEAEHSWSESRTWHEAVLGTAGHNWWSFEFCGLVKTAICFPEFRGVERFLGLWPTYWERELSLTLGADGYSAEQSMSYHIALVEPLTATTMLARMNGLKIPASVSAGLRRCADINWRLVAPDGTLPAFGDYKGGPGIARMRDCAAVFGIGESKYVADKLDPPVRGEVCREFPGMLPARTMFGSVGGDRLARYRRVRAKRPASVDTALRAAGLYAMRDDWSPSANCVVIEAAPKGFVVNSHGHTSLLNFTLHAHGTPILIDSEYSWESDPDSRKSYWRVGSFSHNVATVDGEHQLPIRGMFRWNQVVTPTVDDFISEKRFAYFSGVHEAYERLENKVTASRRKLFMLRDGYWILIDRFTASSREHAHEYTQHFQVAPPSEFGAEGRLVTKGSAGNLMIVPARPLPGDGDYAPPQAAIEPCPVPNDAGPNPWHVTYTRRTQGHGLFVSVLVPFVGARPPKVEARLLGVEADGRTLSPWEATGLEVRVDGRRDVYVDQHMIWTLPWRAGGKRGRGRVFHSACG